MSEGNFEARKIGMRQNKEGVIISFVVQPDDFSSALAMVPIGARLMIGWAQIGDDENRIENDEESTADDAPKPAMVEAAKLHKELVSEQRVARARRQFSELPLSQQAVLRCRDANFKTFVKAEYGLGDDEDVADKVRKLCRVQSRAEFDTFGLAADLWKTIDAEYQQFMTDQKYAGARR